jgi:hypothetical protein
VTAWKLYNSVTEKRSYFCAILQLLRGDLQHLLGIQQLHVDLFVPAFDE